MINIILIGIIFSISITALLLFKKVKKKKRLHNDDYLIDSFL